MKDTGLISDQVIFKVSIVDEWAGIGAWGKAVGEVGEDHSTETEHYLHRP